MRAVPVPGGAGWHGARGPVILASVTGVPVPPPNPGLGPVERVWLHLRERFLPPRVSAGRRAVVDASGRLVAARGRHRSLWGQPWIEKVSSQDRRHRCVPNTGSPRPDGRFHLSTAASLTLQQNRAERLRPRARQRNSNRHHVSVLRDTGPMAASRLPAHVEP